MSKFNKAVYIIISVIFITSEIQCKPNKQNSTQSTDDFDPERLLETIRKLAKQAGLENTENIGTDEQEGLCLIQPCLQSSIEILEAINFKANPCSKSGFGKYACERRLHRRENNFHQSEYRNRSLMEWRNSKNENISLEILESPLKPVGKESSKGIFNAKIYYKQCLDFDENSKLATKALWKLSETFGGWPIFTGDEVEDFKWEHFAAYLAQFNAKTFLFDVSPIATEDGLELTLDKGTIASEGFSDRMDIREELKVTVRNIVKHFNDSNTKLPESFSLGYYQTINSYQNLLRYSYSIPDARTKMNISELTAFTHNRVGWLGFFKTAYKGTTIDIKENTYVHVNAKYVETFTKLWHSAGTWEASLLQYELFRQLGKFTSMFPDEKFQKKCEESATSFFGAAMSKEFLRGFPYTEDIKQDITTMMQNVFYGIKKSVEDSKFLFLDGRTTLREKLEKVKPILGYPKFVDHHENFTKYHSKLKLFKEDGKHFLGNVIKLEIWREGVDREGFSPSDENLHYWGLNNFIVESRGATYWALANALLIPAPTIAPPIYIFGAPGYINYGRLGAIFGHEFGHAIDPNGISYDKDGNFNKQGLLKSGDREIYYEWISSIKDSYKKAKLHHHFKDVPSSTKIDSTSTLPENVADIIGLQAAFNAYQILKQTEGHHDLKLPGLTSLKDEQLFFLSYSNMWCAEMTADEIGDLHEQKYSPGYNRATVPLMRSQQFNNTFNCNGTTKHHNFGL